MQSFEFKPALLRERENWTIDSGMLTCNGELYCSLANVEHAHFGEAIAQQSHSAWLDLKSGDTRRRIECTAPRGNENSEQFLALCREVLAELASIKPEMKVAIGVGGAARWIYFLLGLLMFIAGILGAGFAGEISPDLAVFVMVGGAIISLAGAALAYVFRPWVAPKRLIVSDASDHVAARSLNGDPSTAEQDGETPEEDKGQGAASGRAD